MASSGAGFNQVQATGYSSNQLARAQPGTGLSFDVELWHGTESQDVGLMKTKLDFFYGGMNRDETSGIWRPTDISTQINITMPQSPICVSQNTFLVIPQKDPTSTDSITAKLPHAILTSSVLPSITAVKQ